MKLTEEEKNNLLSNYSGDTSDSLLNHLKRNYPVINITYSWSDKPIKFIRVGDKIRPLENNKKYLVEYITNLLEDRWISIGTPKIRKTIKKYLDGIK